MDLSKKVHLIDLLGAAIGSEVSNLADEKLLSKDNLGMAFVTSIEKALSDVSDVSVKVDVDNAEMKVYARLSRKPLDNSFKNLAIEDSDDIKDGDIYVNNNASRSDGDEEHLEYLHSYDLNNDLSGFSRSLIKKISDYFKKEVSILEKKRELEAFINKKGEIVSGTVIAFESGNCVVNLGLGDGFLSKYEIMPNDFLSVGSQIKAYIYDVRFNEDGYQVLLSRSRNEFLVGIMCAMIPELENRSMTILKAVRDAGMRSKVAVHTESSMIDPVGCCIGRDGVRIKVIRSEVGNERIDIVLWDEDPAVFIANALYPIVVQKLIFDDENTVEVIVSDEDFNRAKAHRHQQVRLASRLTGYLLKLITESDDVQRSENEKSAIFNDFYAIGLNEFEIRMLLEYGINYIDDFANASVDSMYDVLSDIYDKDAIVDFINKAKAIVEEKIKNAYKEYGLDLELMKMPYVDVIPIEVLYEHKIISLNDIVHLEAVELSEIIGDYLDADTVIENCQEIIDWAKKGDDVV